MDFKKLLERDYVILDGGMGTMLQAAGLKLGEIPEVLAFTSPDTLINIHKEYANSGADIIYANTFGANRHKLRNSGYTVSEIIKKALENAKEAVKGIDTLVALDVGPIGQLLEPTGTLTFEEAYDIFKEIIVAGKDNCDVIVFETMTDLYELKAAVLAAKENSDLPIMCTMTFEENYRTFTGCSISAMALTMEGLGVDAIGMNCSLGPKEMYEVVKELAAWTTLPMIVKPNAGLPDPETNLYNITEKEFADYMVRLADIGVKIYGGCCGTTPKFIKELKNALNGVVPKKNVVKKVSAICSPCNTVVIDRPRVIGERINPTGKKLFKEALKNNDIDYILNQALEQIDAGADILDVNVGLPEINEKEMMVKVVKALQAITDVPLQLDSTIPEVLEAGLRVYNGKPIVNSVNGEEEVIEKILPIVKKYGASVVGLALDNGGIPKEAKGRFDIAKKIKERAAEYNIAKEDVFIDCLTLTASTEQDGVMETLNALKMVKDELGLKTVLGVSNISFGLPNRELVNHIFLTMALTYGLDLPIINPNVASMMGAVRSFAVLKGIDRNSIEYIEAYNNNKTVKQIDNTDNKQMDIKQAILSGLKGETKKLTKKLLEDGVEALKIVDDMLIPALDLTGADFENGKIFLPQLIMSAEAAQAAFEAIKEDMINKNNAPVSKGKIILATVKGDIHDIGKNIVKVLLENYGYNVIDLGKDVPYEKVVETAIKEDVKLVGLSALMTTTLVSMEKTIELLRESGHKCTIMVGGAVLTPDYAIKIGADYYAKDAKESVDIAKKVLG